MLNKFYQNQTLITIRVKLRKGILYIDSGAGTSKLPIRFLNRGQISRISIIGTGE